jgi:predicted nucleic acid-binding protein
MDEFRNQLLTNQLQLYQIVGIDSAIFIYTVEDHPRYTPLATTVLSGMAEQQYIGVTSVITLTEVTVQPWRAKREMVAREYETLLAHFPTLRLVDIDRDIARHAARLRAHFGIRTLNALQVATAMEHGATGFVTNDRELQRLVDIIDVIIRQKFVRG